MAPINNKYDNMISNSIGKSFTLNEVIEFERNMQFSPTGTTLKYRWVNSKSHAPVAFGVNK